jgi:hypothetical protein
MAGEPGALDELGRIVPSVYYDLIARVCAGVPLLTIILWEKRSAFGEVTWSKLSLLLGAGYIVGLVLTPLCLPWGPVQFLTRRLCKMPPWEWDEGWSLMDQITAKDKEAGATLAKMQAEAVLCQKLFGGFVLLIGLNAMFPITLISSCGAVYRTLILLLLGICTVHRIAAYVLREKQLYAIYIKRDSGHQAADARHR